MRSRRIWELGVAYNGKQYRCMLFPPTNLIIPPPHKSTHARIQGDNTLINKQVYKFPYQPLYLSHLPHSTLPLVVLLGWWHLAHHLLIMVEFHVSMAFFPDGFAYLFSICTVGIKVESWHLDLVSGIGHFPSRYFQRSFPNFFFGWGRKEE
jgi:hypothetical protein